MNIGAVEKAKEITNKYKGIRLDILTTMDSIPCIISDYPTILTAKILAGYEVRAIIDAHFMKKDSGHKTFWLNVLEEINNLNVL